MQGEALVLPVLAVFPAAAPSPLGSLEFGLVSANPRPAHLPHARPAAELLRHVQVQVAAVQHGGVPLRVVAQQLQQVGAPGGGSKDWCRGNGGWMGGVRTLGDIKAGGRGRQQCAAAAARLRAVGAGGDTQRAVMRWSSMQTIFHITNTWCATHLALLLCTGSGSPSARSSAFRTCSRHAAPRQPQ